MRRCAPTRTALGANEQAISISSAVTALAELGETVDGRLVGVRRVPGAGFQGADADSGHAALTAAEPSTAALGGPDSRPREPRGSACVCSFVGEPRGEQLPVRARQQGLIDDAGQSLHDRSTRSLYTAMVTP